MKLRVTRPNSGRGEAISDSYSRVYAMFIEQSFCLSSQGSAACSTDWDTSSSGAEGLS